MQILAIFSREFFFSQRYFLCKGSVDFEQATRSHNTARITYFLVDKLIIFTDSWEVQNNTKYIFNPDRLIKVIYGCQLEFYKLLILSRLILINSNGLCLSYLPDPITRCLPSSDRYLGYKFTTII